MASLLPRHVSICCIDAFLFQGSTKVFKTRPGHRPTPRASDVEVDLTVTRQRMHVSIPDNGALFLLPDPVTCFRSAKYDQIQTIRLSSSASLVVLDWYTSGRKSIGEEWVFDRYYSLNEVFIDGKRVARDATLLESTPPTSSPASCHLLDKLASKMSPYSCYATVLLFGPLTRRTRDALAEAYKATTVFKQAAKPPLIWSFSIVGYQDTGAVLRVAATETEDVRSWLKVALQGLQEIVGVDVYRKALG